MKNPLFSAIYFITILTSGLSIHQAFAQRGPSVEPMTEISLEDSIPKKDHKGFDFQNHDVALQKTSPKRVPANIVTKMPSPSSPYSYVGPMIFLLALPLALWIVVSKKIKQSEKTTKVDYYSKTHQFKPYKADLGSRDVEDDDQDYPRAS